MGFENSGIRPKPIEFSKMDIKVDIPKTFFNKQIIMVVKQNYNNYLNYLDFNQKYPNDRIIYRISNIEFFKYIENSK